MVNYLLLDYYFISRSLRKIINSCFFQSGRINVEIIRAENKYHLHFKKIVTVYIKLAHNVNLHLIFRFVFALKSAKSLNKTFYVVLPIWLTPYSSAPINCRGRNILDNTRKIFAFVRSLFFVDVMAPGGSRKDFKDDENKICTTFCRKTPKIRKHSVVKSIRRIIYWCFS